MKEGAQLGRGLRGIANIQIMHFGRSRSVVPSFLSYAIDCFRAVLRASIETHGGGGFYPIHRNANAAEHSKTDEKSHCVAPALDS